ncbi:hypothetical protein IE53DRAFT_87016 [Violaceomyces palustris]|uniref:Uncharacterized protein n=1 Tax=Violaceomyces palustris TaxID=1673888 RepID=A0ACD0NXJ8_9BASI|nr:hypothetical protein IE53DRAFT_87016 [Violaceomyces palustris]
MMLVCGIDSLSVLLLNLSSTSSPPGFRNIRNQSGRERGLPSPEHGLSANPLTLLPLQPSLLANSFLCVLAPTFETISNVLEFCCSFPLPLTRLFFQLFSLRTL